MPSPWLMERAESVALALGPSAQAHGRRLLEIAQHWAERRGPELPSSERLALRRELGTLVELLSRRGSDGIGLATLGRILLAELAGDVHSATQCERECDEKLTALGY